MNRPGRTLATWLAIAGFVAFLAWSTLGSQKATCEVCVTYGGGDQCASASASNQAEAKRSAQTTACGPLAKGMDATIQCGNVTPRKVTCSGS